MPVRRKKSELRLKMIKIRQRNAVLRRYWRRICREAGPILQGVDCEV